MDFARLACSGTALCCATNGPMASIWFNTHRIHVCYIYGNIYHQYTPNVGINTIHGSYGIWFNMVQGLPRLNWASFFTSLHRNHPSTSAMHPGGEIEGWNPCIVGCDIRSLQKVLLKFKKRQRMLHGFAKVLDLLTLFFMFLDLLTLFLHGSGSDLET